MPYREFAARRTVYGDVMLAASVTTASRMCADWTSVRRAICRAVFASLTVAPFAAQADESADREPFVFTPPRATQRAPVTNLPSLVTPLVAAPLVAEAQTPAPAWDKRERRSQPRLDWETGENRSYLIPALDIIGFDVLLNRFDYLFFERSTYDVSYDSFKRNLHASWVFDNDPYAINQLGHPYQGSMYHGFARSAGLDFWTSLGYTFSGSILWELAGETTPPSRNDQIASGIGGSFLGEPLFRMANLLLEKGRAPKFWRELGAAIISPATGFNRHAFGDRFKTIFPSNDPAYDARLDLGASLTTRNERGITQPLEQHEAIADFNMEYGLPGKRDYAYRRPFDYFKFQVSAATGNGVESLTSRGLLLGKDYGADADRYRGLWGLYGSYDYIAPQIFRVSSVALSLGNLTQWWLSRSVALQATALLGAGYGAAGTIRGIDERDYHYGFTPQMLIGGKLVFGNRAALDVTLRDYYVSRVASTEARGHENIARADATLTYRIHRAHAVSLKYLWTRRDAHYPDLGRRTQSRATISLFYSILLGSTRMGAVEWRQPEEPMR